MKAVFRLRLLAGLGLLLAACSDQGSAPGAQQSSSDIALDADDIGGVVTSANGSEAGV